jgi:hypothetical protein
MEKFNEINKIIDSININIDHNNINKYSFDHLTKLLHNKSNIKKFNSLFIEFYKISKMEYNNMPRSILTTYVITLFKDIVTTPNNPNNKLLHCLSNQIFKQHVNLFTKRNSITIENIERITKLYQAFNIIFEKWKKKDKYLILDDLIKIYFETEELKHISNQNQEYVHIVRNQSNLEQSEILKKIKLIGGDEGIKYFEEQKNLVESFQQQFKQLQDNIEKNVYNAYWDVIKDKLSQDPPETDVLLDLLKETQLLLCSCVPSRQDLHIKIVQDLDIDYLDNLIKNKAIDDKEIIIYIYKIIKWIDEFNSSKDTYFKEWKETLNKDLEGYGIEYFERNIDIKNVIPDIFRYLLEKITNIIQESEKFKNTELYKSIKNKKK